MRIEEGWDLSTAILDWACRCDDHLSRLIEALRNMAERKARTCFEQFLGSRDHLGEFMNSWPELLLQVANAGPDQRSTQA